MATAKTKKKSSGTRRTPRKANPPKRSAGAASVKRHHSRAKAAAPRRRSRRMNAPSGDGMGGVLMSGLYVIGGALGSKLGTQMILGDKNVGFMGYGFNIALGIGLSLLVGKGFKNRKGGAMILIGSVAATVLRAVVDLTPFGKIAANAGLGDYQASNFVTPQRYVDALNSAEVEIPNGWAPTTVINSNAAPAGMMAPPSSGVNGFSDLYGGNGLYQ